MQCVRAFFQPARDASDAILILVTTAGKASDGDWAPFQRANLIVRSERE